MELNLIFISLYLGILTSISPCPLASNIAAISFISQEIIERKYIFFSSLLYTLGRQSFYFLEVAWLKKHIRVLKKESFMPEK